MTLQNEFKFNELWKSFHFNETNRFLLHIF